MNNILYLSVNNNKQHSDRKNGINNKINKAVIGIHIKQERKLNFTLNVRLQERQEQTKVEYLQCV